MRQIGLSFCVAIVGLGCSSGDGRGSGSQRTNQADVVSARDAGESTGSDIATVASSPDTQNAVNSPSNPQVQLLPAACFAGASGCDPRSGEGCTAGEACDFSSAGQLVCFPPPNTAELGQSCNNQGGPFCASGGWCVPDTSGGPGICRKVCCSDGECSEPGVACVGLLTNPSMGAIGVCRTPPEPGDSPQCLPYGAPCTMSNDQCCGQCHFDHCH